jgi:hypothetical protein
VEVPADGTGLILAADGAVATTDLPSTGVPIRIVQRPRMQLLSRLADTAPFWGGARIVNADNGAGCSSGFAVTSGGVNYLLTAGHCGRPGGGWYNGDRSRFIGTATRENVAHDLLLVPTSAAGRIYDGGVGVGEFSKGVVGWDWAIPGEYVCQSGSVSGAVCGIRNTNSFQYTLCDTDPYGNYECYSDLILAQKTDGGLAARHGDSGGPVFTLSGTSNVVAKGTITGGGGSWLVYQDFGTAWRDFGIVPLTG